jgi:hypothetical protein
MYKIVKLTENDVDVYIVLHAATGKEVFRSGTYDEAYRFVLSK